MKALIILLLLATVVMGQTFEEKLKEKMKENRAKFKEAYNLKDSDSIFAGTKDVKTITFKEPTIKGFIDFLKRKRGE